MAITVMSYPIKTEMKEGVEAFRKYWEAWIAEYIRLRPDGKVYPTAKLLVRREGFPWVRPEDLEKGLNDLRAALGPSEAKENVTSIWAVGSSSSPGERVLVTEDIDEFDRFPPTGVRGNRSYGSIELPHNDPTKAAQLRFQAKTIRPATLLTQYNEALAADSR